MVVQIKNVVMLVYICLLPLLSGCGSVEAQASENPENNEVAVATVQTIPTVAPTDTAKATAQHEHSTTATTTQSSTDKTQSDNSATDAASSSEESSTTAVSDDVVLLTIDMHDSYYGVADTNLEDPPVWTVTTGKTLLITLINHGKMRHNWAIMKLGSAIPSSFESETSHELVLAQPGMVYASSQTQWALRAPEPGEYVVICTVEGHFPSMQGKLIVTEAIPIK